MKKKAIHQSRQYLITTMQPIGYGRIESPRFECGQLSISSPKMESCVFNKDANMTISQENVKIRRGRVESVCLYEVTESELDGLEKGSQGDVYLNFSIFCISTGLSTLVVLLTTDIKNCYLYLTFVATIIVTLLGGTVLLTLWWKIRNPIKALIARIKMRVHPDIAENE